MIHALRSLINDNIEAALARHAFEGDDVTWDTGYTLVPIGPGQAQVQSMFIVQMTSPILGQPPLIVPTMLDLRQLRNEKTANDVILAAMTQLRELRSKMLAINEAPHNGG